jgi:hypothetical protein
VAISDDALVLDLIHQEETATSEDRKTQCLYTTALSTPARHSPAIPEGTWSCYIVAPQQRLPAAELGYWLRDGHVANERRRRCPGDERT